MKREVTVFPAADVQVWPGDTWPNGSPYGGSPQITLWEAWSDNKNSAFTETNPCDTGSAWTCGWFNPGPGAIRNDGLLAVSFEKPPTQCLYTKVTVAAWWDYSSYGPNNWYFSPTQPRARLAIRNRAKDGWLYGSYLNAEEGTNWGDHPTGEHYCRINMPNCGSGYSGGAIAQTWEMTSHPEGGVFTLDDMIHLAAGIEWNVPDPAYDNSQGGFQKLRCFKLHVVLEIIDLGGFVRNIRHATSEALRFSRLARRSVTYSTPLDQAVAEPGERYSLAWNRGANVIAGRGWGEKPYSRRRIYVGSKTTYPELKKVEYETLDLHGLACLAWASFRIAVPWSPELNGLAYLDQGGDFSVDRDADAWAPRPGDGVLARVLEDYLQLDYEGAPVEGSGDEEQLLYNTNPGNVTGWEQTGVSGALTLTTPDGDAMVQELGYEVSAHMAFGGAGTGVGGYVTKTGIDIAANDATIMLGWRVGVRNVSVNTPASEYLEAVLVRVSGAGTEYWDATARTWGGSIVYNPIPSDRPYGEIVSDNIPTTIGGQTTATYKMRVGRWSGALANCTFVAAICNLQKGTAAHGVRSPLVTLDEKLTRGAAVLRLENASTGRIWYGDRGTAIAEFRPCWRADTIHTGPFAKCIVYAYHSATEYDRIDVVPVDADTRSLRFRRHVGGTDYDVSVAIVTDLTREHVVRAWARWLDADGWEDFAPYTISAGFAVFNRSTGLLVEQGQAHVVGPSSAPTLDADAYVLLGSDGGSGYLDGWLRWWETQLNPLASDEIVWRW